MDKWFASTGDTIRVFVGYPADGRVLQATVPNIRSVVYSTIDALRKAFEVSPTDLIYCAYDEGPFGESCVRDFENFMEYVRKTEGFGIPA